MKSNNCGVTKFYNDFHSPENIDSDLQIIRALQSEINNSVLECYGDFSIDLDNGFHNVGYLPNGKNTRFTLSEIARKEVLYRLAMLNKLRHGEDVAPNNKVKGKNIGEEHAANSHPDLFGD